MTRIYTPEETWLVVPNWVNDLESFRRWSDDDAFPENGRISFLRGEVCVDMGKEQLFTHNRLKTVITIVLGGMVDARRLGLYFGDGAFLSNVEADVSNQPDGMFVATESVRSGRVRIVEGRASGHVELEGSPDMVLEVVSDSSVTKDTVTLREDYAAAGVREYWLIDARSEPARFDILKLAGGAYAATRRRGGWLRSGVFACDFRLTPQDSELGFPAFALEARPVGG